VIFVKSYPPELKANIVKEHVEKGVSCSQLSKTHNIPVRNIQKWVKKFRDSGENYSCFFKSSFNKNSIVSRGSKIPPVVYENSGVDLDEISRLCMEYPELAQTLQSLKDLVIEKDMEIRVLREQVEFVKKNLNQRK
jgi:hypothetical protein